MKINEVINRLEQLKPDQDATFVFYEKDGSMTLQVDAIEAGENGPVIHGTIITRVYYSVSDIDEAPAAAEAKLKECMELLSVK